MVIQIAPPPPVHIGLVTPEEQKRIDLAIDRGLAFLRHLQLPTGLWHDGMDNKELRQVGRGLQMVSKRGRHQSYPVGYTALPGLTLLVCGCPRTDPGVQQAAHYVRLAAPTLTRTYEISLAVLFLDQLGKPEDRQLLKSLVLRLAAGQNVTGGWGYTCPILTRSQEQKLLKLMRQRRDALLTQLEVNRKALKEPTPSPEVTKEKADAPAASSKCLCENSRSNIAKAL
jgi:hypothetical protein